MAQLAENIRQAIRLEQYVVSVHAARRLRQRRITTWQVVAGLAQATLLRERKSGQPYPVAEFEQVLADGTTVKAVWAWIAADRAAMLVTVHFFPRLDT